jgi:glycine/D-amino acid oxidase-like deaminating enzyme
VERYWREEYMQKSFLGWGDSGAEADCIWVGIQGYTADGKAHIGRVPSLKGEAELVTEGEEGGMKKQQWMLAGFNGGGMAQIALAARAVAKMVVCDLEFEDVRGEFGLVEGCGTSLERLKGGM